MDILKFFLRPQKVSLISQRIRKIRFMDLISLGFYKITHYICENNGTILNQQRC
jgi:hypothetical protein